MKRTRHIAAIGVVVAAFHGAMGPALLQGPPAKPGKAEQSRAHAFRDSPKPIIARNAAPPRFVASWHHGDEGEGAKMILPVFDATVASGRTGLAVLGGFTAKLETTQVVQIFDERRGWQPIGSQLLEPRAGHTMTPLGDGRVLIVGGVQGTLGGDLRVLDSCEVLNPFVAGSKAAPPIDAPMYGHTAHALQGGRVAIVGGDAVRIFDGATRSWIRRIPLQNPRSGHASVLLTGGDLLVIGGDAEGTVEQVRLDLADPATVPTSCWLATLRGPYTHMSAVALPDGNVLVAGGIDGATGRSTDRTWMIKPAEHAVADGPALALDRGVAQPALFVEHPMVVVVGGEWVEGDSRGPVGDARLVDVRKNKLWSLVPMPSSRSRMTWFRSHDGNMTAWGGYRFVAAADAAREKLTPGIHLSNDRYVLRLGRLPVPRD